MAKKKAVAEELKAPAVKGLLRDVPDPTVYLNGVLRFDDDHIIRVKYDPTSKAMVIDDVPQSLESSITLGEGGGGSLANPILTVKLVNSVIGNNVEMLAYSVADGKLVLGYLTVSPGENDTAQTLASFNETEEDYRLDLYYNIPSALINGYELAVSDAVNCSEDEGLLTITDPDSPASVTVTVTAGLG